MEKLPPGTCLDSLGICAPRAPDKIASADKYRNIILVATCVNHDRSAITDKVLEKIIRKKPSQKELSLTH